MSDPTWATNWISEGQAYDLGPAETKSADGTIGQDFLDWQMRVLGASTGYQAPDGSYRTYVDPSALYGAKGQGAGGPAAVENGTIRWDGTKWVPNTGGAGGGGGGGTGGTGGGGGAAEDFRAQAAGLFPWLTGALLDQFSEFWAETGSSTAALGRLRNTAEYDRVFAGIKRSDGTLRMDENSYFSTKVGFREALSEFGRQPGDYESMFVKMIENEVGADEFMRGLTEAYNRFIEPGSNADGGLFDAFLSKFIDTASLPLALQEVRQSDAYANVFLGNRREDGTIRMDEQEWFAYKRGWSRTLAGFGLNPEEFIARDRLRASVEGEISVQELNQRLQATQDGIMDNIEAVQRFYAQGYGLEVSAEAILGMAIDPSIQKDVLERRINAGQIGGEASTQGYLRSVERAEALARMGVSQTQARELYGNAAKRLTGLSSATSRFNLGATSLDNFEDVMVGGDAAQGLRIERGLQREESSFSRTLDTRTDDFGLGGLRQR